MDNNENISVKRENVLNAYKNANDEQKKLIEMLFGKNMFKMDVTERIKTFEDACAEIGENHPYVMVYKELVKLELSNQEDLIAYLKLRIVTAALNEVWEPQFTYGEYRWFPRFYIWTDAELAHKSEWERDELYIIDGAGFKVECAGFSPWTSDYATTDLCESVGSRICYKSEKLAVYSGLQFADLWADFYLIRK